MVFGTPAPKEPPRVSAEVFDMLIMMIDTMHTLGADQGLIYWSSVNICHNSCMGKKMYKLDFFSATDLYKNPECRMQRRFIS